MTAKLEKIILLIHLHTLVFLGYPSICITGTLSGNLHFLSWEDKYTCYGEIGCLNITRSWYRLPNRPINVFPNSRSEINTEFILYTRNNPSQGQIIKVQDEERFKQSNFDPKKVTKFIIHGFLDSSKATWVGNMKDELIKAEDMNIIAVNWSGGSVNLYSQAVANTRLIGLEIAYFINYIIKNYDLEARKVHLIGHSLGAHTAGYAGERVPGLGRISGLDPAELGFQGMPNFVRLDPSDAELVDVIHTDTKSILNLGLGMSQACGHLDFYPNNGKEQPGCGIKRIPLAPLTLIRKGLDETWRIVGICNHDRVLKLFTESINSKCPYVAHQCPSYEHYVAGKCFSCEADSSTGGCALMGYHADKSPVLELENAISLPHIQDQPMPSRGLYFIKTGGSFPFCQRNYRISIQLAKPRDAANWVPGFLKVTLHGDAGVIYNLDFQSVDDTKLEHGSTHAVVTSHPTDLAGKIRKAELNWIYERSLFKPRSLCLFRCNDHLYVKSVSVEELELPGIGKQHSEFSKKLCPSGQNSYADIPNHGKGFFYDDCSP